MIELAWLVCVVEPRMIAAGSERSKLPLPGGRGWSKRMDVYLNGRMVAAEQALVRADDAGFQHAVGLFETFCAHHGRVFRLQQHLERLAGSARDLGLARQINIEPLTAAVEQVIAHNGISEARIRLTLTPGSLSMLKPGESEPVPTLLITPSELTVYDPAYFEQGVRVLIAPPGANPFDPTAGHKTLNYWQRLRTLRQAAALDAGEAIWLNVTNHLAGGAISNLFLVSNGKLLTPIARGEEEQGALPAPVLPGVIRQTIIELAEVNHIEVERQMLTVEELLDADEVFLTNSSWYVLPVTQVEKKTIGSGNVSWITQTLRQKLLELVQRETGGQ
ncbi:MAG: aminotransferase class IV family protein [Phycisphaeraceae bacterium]|nr:aminotransferase class IV family protein [Phycisphaeraceae bacterium]